MRLPEGQALVTHEGIGKFGDGDAGRVGVATHVPGVDRTGRQEGGEQIEHPPAAPECAVACLLHFAFAVVHVGEGGVVHRVHHHVAAPTGDRRQVAHMLDRNRIALLRHDRADLDQRVGHVELADLEAGPEGQILDDAAQVQEYQLDRGIEAGDVIHRGDTAIGIHQRALEPQ